MKITKHFLLFLMCTLTITLYAQEETEEQKKDTRPVRDPFESSYLINNQTIIVNQAKTLEYVIQHRFGKMNSEGFDLLGLYAPSNIRFGLCYSLTDFLQVGVGSTKNNKLQDANVKVALLRQTRSGNIPVGVTYFSNVSIDVRKDVFTSFSNRFTYFHQLIIARKFHRRFSMQVSPSFTHFNIVAEGRNHDVIGVSSTARVKVRDQMNILLEYDHPLTSQPSDESLPNIGLGIELVTSAHAFQIFVSTFNRINSQYDYMYNDNSYTDLDFLLGFNMTRLWNF
ncbi:MAG: hypothetical protein HQ500_09285 [Flavobacteriales bacterium]|nr:hypothetical protein [Flavobacteriales bacterium]